MHYVATEVGVAGNCAADVLASDGKNLIEYEVKVSLADLTGDNKKPKHIYYDPTPLEWDGLKATKGKRSWIIKPYSGYRSGYRVHDIKDDKDNNPTSGWTPLDTEEEAKEWLEENYGAKRGCPNVLYYVIPRLLWEKSEEKIRASLHDSYGVITFTSDNPHSLTVEVKAKKLHKNEVSQGSLKKIISRMSSELAGLTALYYTHVNGFTQLTAALQDKADMKEVDDE
jgi:hypothetical protein